MRITTSVPPSTSRFARSRAASATRVWSSTGSSNVEAITSPRIERRMSVTSSGRSPISSTIRWMSGLLAAMPWAIDCRSIVLPAFGGETISAR